jgi:glycosyltransferase involved in cell wall biosynthesis
MRRVVYLSWPADEISGGIKMAFRHVEALTQWGFPACVATPDAKPPGWFVTSAPLIAVADVNSSSDILVFPENHPGFLKHFAASPNRKIVFCQNQFMIYRGVEGVLDYADYGVQDVICPGYECAEFCRGRLRVKTISVIPSYVETKLFFTRENKKLQIAFTPRKRPSEGAVIRDLFRSCGEQYRKIPWIEIAKATEAQVALILGESALFLSLCRFEALPLSLLEAMASGRVVAGFSGQGGRDFVTVSNGFWAAEDDCFECARQLERAARVVMDFALTGGFQYQDVVRRSIDTAALYAQQRFKDRMKEYYEPLIKDQ